MSFIINDLQTCHVFFAWRIPATGEPGGLPSMGSQSQTQLKQLSSSICFLSGSYPRQLLHTTKESESGSHLVMSHSLQPRGP